MSYGVQDLSLNNRSLCSASSYVFNSDNMSANTATVNGQLTTNVTLQVYDPLPSSGTNDGTAIYPITLSNSLTVLNPGNNVMNCTLAPGTINQMKTISIVSSSAILEGSVVITLTGNHDNNGTSYPYEITLSPNTAISTSQVTLLYSISAVNNWLIISSTNATITKYTTS